MIGKNTLVKEMPGTKTNARGVIVAGNGKLP